MAAVLRQDQAIPHPSQAALPPISKPQSYNLGERPRVAHLPRFARIADDAVPVGLEDPVGLSSQNSIGLARGHSYRNAALQVLLNTPIFVNFARAHQRHVRLSSNQQCSIKNCLLCSFVYVAGPYWTCYRDATRYSFMSEAVLNLWKICLETFWGPNARGRQKIGPANEIDEFYTESFLLHLLAEIQRQLEVNPAEYQTFQRLFTTEIKRSRKCSNTGCKWTSSSFRWEQSLFLPIDMRKPVGKNTHTDIFAGIKLALDQEPKDLSMRKGSMGATLKCPSCNLPSVLHTEIVSFPEVLILVRNMDNWTSGDRPDIPLMEFLDLHALSPDQHDKSKQVAYMLTSGTAERLVGTKQTKSVAFARGGRQTSMHLWWMLESNENSTIIQLENGPVPAGLPTLDMYQRSFDYNGASYRPQVFPEVFVYVRSDSQNIKQADFDIAARLAGMGEVSPNEFDNGDGDLVARSVTDIFTQKIGNGLLKFNVKFTPADPQPHESVPFTLNVGYEHKNCIWYLEDPIYGRLLPAPQHALDPPDTPAEKRTYTRFSKRKAGVATPTEPTEAQLQLAGNDGVKLYPVSKFDGGLNPFDGEGADLENQMLLDNEGKVGFTDNPVILSVKRSADNAAVAAQFQPSTWNREQDWKKHHNNGQQNGRPNKKHKGNKGNKINNHNNWNNGNGNNNNRYNNNNNSNRGGRDNNRGGNNRNNRRGGGGGNNNNNNG